MNTLTYNLLSSQGGATRGMGMVDSVLQTATKLEQWDIRAPEGSATEASTLFKVFQSISNATDLGAVRQSLDGGFLNTLNIIISPNHTERSLKSSLRTLGILAEVDDIMTSISPENIRDAWTNMQARESSVLNAR